MKVHDDDDDIANEANTDTNASGNGISIGIRGKEPHHQKNILSSQKTPIDK